MKGTEATAAARMQAAVRIMSLGSGAGHRLGRAEDAGGAALLLRGLLAIAVGRDHDLGPLGQLAAGDDGIDLLAVERLALQQGAGEALEEILVAVEELARLGVRLEDEAADLVVDLVGDRLGVVAAARTRSAVRPACSAVLAISVAPSSSSESSSARRNARAVMLSRPPASLAAEISLLTAVFSVFESSRIWRICSSSTIVVSPSLQSR